LKFPIRIISVFLAGEEEVLQSCVLLAGEFFKAFAKARRRFVRISLPDSLVLGFI